MYGENTIQYSKEQSDSYSKLQEDRFNKSISLKDKIKKSITDMKEMLNEEYD